MYLVHLYKQGVAQERAKIEALQQLDLSSYHHLNLELVTTARVNQGSTHIYYI
jgi:hypothetical protein